MRNLLINLLKTLGTGAALVAVIAVAAIIYALATLGRVSMDYIVTANFVVGALIIAISLINYIIPVRLGRSKLIDHTTYAERLMEAREAKRTRAFGILYTGIAMIVITGTIEMIYWWAT